MTRRARRLATATAVVLTPAVLSTGCVRHIDDAHPAPGSVAAPIIAAQAVDLLSDQVRGEEGNKFVTAQPDRCSGLAQEVEPPFIEARHPLATDGGHWTTPDGSVYVEEMVAVYRYDFDPSAALADVRAAMADCQGSPVVVTSMTNRSYVFDVQPSTGEVPDGAVVWALRAPDWNCDNALVAAYNAAIEITACGAGPGFDVVALATEARNRIELLANTDV